MPDQYRIPKTYFQKRAQNLGMTMIVMGACFLFYYLGLFGGVKGPLCPETIGTFLSGQGVSRDHIRLACFGILIVSLIWNHLITLACFIMGTRRTCTCKGPKNTPCGHKTKKIRKAKKGTGKDFVKIYQCEKGHCSDTARFHPVKKGMVAHVVWIGAFACTLFVLFYRVPL